MTRSSSAPLGGVVARGVGGVGPHPQAAVAEGERETDHAAVGLDHHVDLGRRAGTHLDRPVGAGDRRPVAQPRQEQAGEALGVVGGHPHGPAVAQQVGEGVLDRAGQLGEHRLRPAHDREAVRRLAHQDQLAGARARPRPTASRLEQDAAVRLAAHVEAGLHRVVEQGDGADVTGRLQQLHAGLDRAPQDRPRLRAHVVEHDVGAVGVAVGRGLVQPVQLGQRGAVPLVDVGRTAAVALADHVGPGRAAGPGAGAGAPRGPQPHGVHEGRRAPRHEARAALDDVDHERHRGAAAVDDRRGGPQQRCEAHLPVGRRRLGVDDLAGELRPRGEQHRDAVLAARDHRAAAPRRPGQRVRARGDQGLVDVPARSAHRPEQHPAVVARPERHHPALPGVGTAAVEGGLPHRAQEQVVGDLGHPGRPAGSCTSGTLPARSVTPVGGRISRAPCRRTASSGPGTRR